MEGNDKSPSSAERSGPLSHSSVPRTPKGAVGHSMKSICPSGAKAGRTALNSVLEALIQRDSSRCFEPSVICGENDDDESDSYICMDTLLAKIQVW